MYNLKRAINFMMDAHADQKDKSGLPYYLHPIRVMSNLIIKYPALNEEVYIASVLHDVFEDTNTSLADLDDEFGYQVCSIVHNLSHDKKDSYKAYINKLRDEAILIKIEDLLDNSSKERLVLLLNADIEPYDKSIARIDKYKKYLNLLQKQIKK